MPAEDPGDVFLRHRGAVLEALVSDPSLESSAAPEAPAAAMSSAGAADSLDDVVPAGEIASLSSAAPDSTPSQRRASSAPKASDRILALLNGQSASPEAGLEFSADRSEAAAARLRGSADTETADASASPPKTENSPSVSPPGSIGDLGHKALVHLRKPKVALTAAAVLVVLLIVALVTTGNGEEPNDREVVVSQASGPGPTSAAAAPTAPATSAIQVKSAQAHCPSGSSDGMDAFAGQPGQAWQCVRAYKVDGQVLTIDLGKTYQVESIGIVPGFDSTGSDGSDQWNKYRTVSRVSYRFNDPNATTYTQQTLDQRNMVTTEMKPAVNASKITLTILASKGESSTNTTAISSIVISGH